MYTHSHTSRSTCGKVGNMIKNIENKNLIQNNWNKVGLPKKQSISFVHHYLLWHFQYWYYIIVFSSVQLLSHVQLFVTLWTTAHQASLSITNSRNSPKPMSIGFSPKPSLTGDAIQPSHPLLFPSPPAFNLSQHQGLFQWVSSAHQVAKVLEFQLQHQSFQWTPRTDLL